MDLTYENIAGLCKKYAACQHPEELFIFLRSLSRYTENIRTIVEIGVHRGGMSAVLHYTFPKAKMYGVEILPIDQPHPPHMESVRLGPDAPTLKQTAPEIGLTIVQGSSQDPTILKKTMEMIEKDRGEKKIDFLFIDGAHDYDSVKRDFELWSPYASIVGFHDIYAVTAGLLRYWNEVTTEYQTFGTFKVVDSLGIGVIIK